MNILFNQGQGTPRSCTEERSCRSSTSCRMTSAASSSVVRVCETTEPMAQEHYVHHLSADDWRPVAARSWQTPLQSTGLLWEPSQHLASVGLLECDQSSSKVYGRLSQVRLQSERHWKFEHEVAFCSLFKGMPVVC